jgi:hypothetical protein
MPGAPSLTQFYRGKGGNPQILWRTSAVRRTVGVLQIITLRWRTLAE